MDVVAIFCIDLGQGWTATSYDWLADYANHRCYL